MPDLPTPHLHKLNACLQNPRLPEDDREKVEESIQRYNHWIEGLQSVEKIKETTIERMVEVTNSYKKFIEFDLIFNSTEDFLYRQKGQLKLDNTILEEFLPQLFSRSLIGIDESYDFGPKKTFSNLSFLSTIGSPGKAGDPSIKTKDQDFVVGKPLYLMTSFNSSFSEYTKINSFLGYVCAECKTNLDKTMFQEAVATSRDLKIAVPGSLYFLVCEFLDMTPVSIISTQIDDVLIVRKAKRMSADQRQEYRTAELRQQHRQAYEEFINSAQYYPDVFQRMINKIQALLDNNAPGENIVLENGYF